MPHSALLELLNLSKDSVNTEPLTMRQLFLKVREYIRRQQLYDVCDPTIIRCGQDPLGRLFGVDSFTIHSVLQLMSENVDAVDTDDDAVSSSSCKWPRLSSVHQLDDKMFIDSSSDTAMSLSRLSPDDVDSCLHRTAMSPLPSVEVTSVSDADKVSDVELQSLTASLPPLPLSSSSSSSSTSSSVSVEPAAVAVSNLESDLTNLPSSVLTVENSAETRLWNLASLWSLSSPDPDAALMPSCAVDGEELSDVETIYSVQSKVTELVKDSTDDLWFLESATDDDNIGEQQFSDGSVFANELDLVSDADNVVVDSDSEKDSILPDEDVIIICESESDLEFFADCEDSDIYDDDDGTSDEELTSADKWVCPMCETENKPLHRYCDFCWNLRPDWLPSNGTVSSQPITNENGDLLRGVESQGSASFGSDRLSSLDSGIMSPGSCDTNRSIDERSPVFPANMEIPMQLAEIPLSTAADSVQSADGTSLLPSVCVICLAAPKNASIVHGSTGHQACCFPCARRLKRTRQHCPVCRRPIHKVIRNYIL